MNNLQYFTSLMIAVFCFSNLYADQQLSIMNKDVYESSTGLNGAYNEKEKVFKATFPRNDIKISVDNTQLDPFMGLTSWTAFTPKDGNKFMVMGDLVLFQDEVNPVMSTLLNNNIEVTALHNHFFYDTPKVYFMHIGGEGSLGDLAGGVKKALDAVKEIRSKNSSPSNNFEGTSISSKNSIDLSSLEKIFGIKGQGKDGMGKFVFGRSVKMDNVTLGSDMGVNTWAAFAGTNENAIVDGDFAVLENELQPVLKALRKGGINIVAIHQHMTMESPRMLFLHYWGKGNAENLAKTVKNALNYTK
jgi:hypothetical protein